jgi:hypothetical protein
MKPKRKTCETISSPIRRDGGSTFDALDFSARPSGSKQLRLPSVTAGTGAAQLKSRTNGAHWEPKFPFDMVIAYEDKSTCERAFSVCDHLIQELQNDHDVQQSWWRFHYLHDPQLLASAIEGALGADMIILSLNNAKEVPWITRRWIEGWLDQKDGRHQALVALVDNTPSPRCADCPILRYLNSVAHIARMDFFSHAFPAAPLRVNSPFATVSERGTTLTPLLEEILRRPVHVPLWGINEY